MAKRGFVQGERMGLDGVEWEREREEKMGLMGGAGSERGVDDQQSLFEKGSPFEKGAPFAHGVAERVGNGRSRSAVDSDDDSSDEGEMGSGARGGGGGMGPTGTIRGRGVERDSMKWPVQPGEGWTAL